MSIYRVNASVSLCLAATAHMVCARASQPLPLLQATPIATLQSQDSVGLERPLIQPQFEHPQISRYGRFLTIQSEKVGPSDGHVFPTARSLQAVELKTGRVTVLSNFENVSGFDQIEDIASDAATPQLPLSTSVPRAGTPWISLGQPSGQPPLLDALKTFMPEGRSGKLVYSAFVRVSGTGDQSQWRTFLTLRQVGQGASTVRTYPVRLRVGGLFSPQWSPDGKMVLLKVGNQGDRTNVYLIHIWNPVTGQLRQGPPEYVSYLKPLWSPDSKRIAYIKGGDIQGRDERGVQPIALRIYDLKTGTSRAAASSIPKGFFPTADFAWAGAKAILYTLTQQPDLRPSIYQVLATGGAPQLVVRDGHKPTPSRDGRWIAFLGSPSADASGNQLGDHLFLFDRATKRRVQVGRGFFGDATQLLWTPDSQRLVIVDARYDLGTGLGTASISTVAAEDATKLLTSRAPSP